MGFVYERTVNYHETDAMGVVHHANYFKYFEDSRVALLSQMGVDFFAPPFSEIVLAVIECSCDFRRPLKFAQKYTVHVQVRKVGLLRVEFQYVIKTLGDPKPVALGRTLHVPVDGKLSPVRIPTQLNQILNQTLEKYPWNETLL